MQSRFNSLRLLPAILLLVVAALIFEFWYSPEDTLSESEAAFSNPAQDRQGRFSAFKPSEESLTKELVKIIEAQLAAFRTNDYTKAYTFAAAAIKQQFSPEAFERMIKTQYPNIAESRTAIFGPVFDNGDEAFVNVGIAGGSSKTINYGYLMKRESSGWRINGVIEGQLKRKPSDGPKDSSTRI